MERLPNMLIKGLKDVTAVFDSQESYFLSFLIS